MLNNLYGIFGRSLQGFKPYIIQKKDAGPLITLLKSKALTNINDNYSLILTDDSTQAKNLAKLDCQVLSVGSKSNISHTRANVAIAAAITSYARIHMMELKLNYDVCYSDTDSVFTTHPLPSHLIGPELGQLKDELGGATIDKAYFLGLNNMDTRIKTHKVFK